MIAKISQHRTLNLPRVTKLVNSQLAENPQIKALAKSRLDSAIHWADL
jgi:hypothetical protein